VLILGERHLRKVLAEYARHYRAGTTITPMPGTPPARQRSIVVPDARSESPHPSWGAAGSSFESWREPQLWRAVQVPCTAP